MSDLTILHDEYRAAVTAARDESLSDESRAKAGADLVAKREALDAALIQKDQDRDDEARSAAVEAREASARRLGSIVTPPEPFISRAKLNDYLEKRTNQATFFFPFEARTDITNEVATTYAGYTVPQTWDDKVSMFRIAQSGVLKAGPTIIKTASGNQMNFPTLATDAAALAGTEGSASTVTNPVFGTCPLNAYRVDLHMAISDELLADSGVNLEDVLSTLAGRAIAAKCAPYYNDTDVGTGSDLPAAVAIGSTLGVTAASQTSVTMDEVKALMYSVLPEYRPNGAFVGNSDLTLEVAVMKDANGNYLWQPSNMAAEPDKLFGHPWYEDAYADASAASNVGTILFGDFAAGYLVRFARGMEVSFSRDFAFTSFETTMRAAVWHDSATIDGLAIKHLAMHA